MNYYYFNSWDNFSLTLKALFKLFKFVSNKSPKATQRTLKSRNFSFSKKRHLRVVPNGVITCSDGIYHSFRRHL